MYFTWIWIILIFHLAKQSYANANKCGYSSCNSGKPGILNVHLIPHTHDDVGWLKTVDQYYYGFKDDIQAAGVQYVLDTVVRALEENPDRKFSYVEMAYFTRWWNEQNNKTKLLVKKLVNEGRLQFLLGGWSMNDEASTHYTAIIDQMTLGLDFLNQTFGECGRPLVAWQIDPFGHSLELSNLFSMMGFDANIFMRLDYRDKDQRMKELRMELVQNTNVMGMNVSKELFTSVLYDTYCPPATFCFDDKCQDPPIMDDPTLHDPNVQQRVNDFADYVISQSKVYTTNHILVPMGCDFQFQNAFHNFVNLDKLIFHVNRLRKDINVMYSTPACYVYSVNNAKKSYSVKYDDFFPYASGPNSFWTGYFTSRAALKGFIRESNNLYQICKQAQVISRLSDVESNRKVKFMGTKMGVLQHHDAVTGTEKQQVAFDYAQRLYNGWSACENVLSSSISSLITNTSDTLSFVTCSLANISYCLPTDNIPYRPLNIVMYNPLAFNHSFWCRIPVSVVAGDVYYVMDSNDKFVPPQLIPITERTRRIPERPKNISANFELVFNCTMPPIGYSSYILLRSKTKSYKREVAAEISFIKKMKGNNFKIQNSNFILYYQNNLLSSIVNIKSRIAANVSQSIRYYYSHQNDGQSSGAYIFRPTTNKPISFNDSVKVDLIVGSLVTEVHQVFSDWATLVTRLYKDSENVESEWTVGPIPITNPAIGREVVLHYNTSLKTNNIFYTDSNSRQFLPRMINKRYDYKFNQTEPVAGNYYPVTSDVMISDLAGQKSIALIIRTDRSIGAGAYQSGMIETMLHRRMLIDDGFGVGEALNELGADGNGLVVRGKQWITLGDTDDIFINRRLENVKIFNKPTALFLKTPSKLNNSKTFIKEFSFLKMKLPKYLHLTSLENHFNLQNEIDYQIIRIENLYDFESSPMTIDLNQIFNSLKIIEIEELNLSANQFLKDVNRLQWNTNSERKFRNVLKNQGTIISLLPTEIRTFKIFLI